MRKGYRDGVVNMSLDDNFFFSQHSLNIFRRCQWISKRYIEGLYWKGTRPREQYREGK